MAEADSDEVGDDALKLGGHGVTPGGHDAGRSNGGGLPRRRGGDGSNHSALRGRSGPLGQHALNWQSLTYP